MPYMDALIEEIKKKLDNKPDFEEEFPKFSDSKYRAFKISKGNFHKIEKADNKKNARKSAIFGTNCVGNKKLAFIDGGNLEILKAANFSLNLVRVYYSIYQNNKKISSKK